MYNPMIWDMTEKPAPQLFTFGELATICNLLEKADMLEDEVYIKMAILRDYAIKHEMQTGRAYLPLQAG